MTDYSIWGYVSLIGAGLVVLSLVAAFVADCLMRRQKIEKLVRLFAKISFSVGVMAFVITGTIYVCFTYG